MHVSRDFEIRNEKLKPLVANRICAGCSGLAEAKMASAPGKLHFLVFNVDRIAFFDVSVIDELNTFVSIAFRRGSVFGMRSVQLARGLSLNGVGVAPFFIANALLCLRAPVLAGRRAKCFNH